MKPLKVNAYLLSVSEVAKRAGVSRQAVNKWLEEGKLKAIKVGRAYVIRKVSLDNWLIKRSLL